LSRSNRVTWKPVEPWLPPAAPVTRMGSTVMMLSLHSGGPGKWRSRVDDPAGVDATSSTFQPWTVTAPVGAVSEPGPAASHL
jgi:hypothetical protein